MIEPTEILVLDEQNDVIDPEAMQINKINYDEHKYLALPRGDVIFELVRYLDTNTSGRGRSIVGGHNVPFDIGFIKRFIGRDLWSDKFEHRVVDTSSILRFLYHSGLVNSDLGSLSNALKYFGFKDEDIANAHNAKVDAHNTARLYNRMLGRIIKREKN